jgi:hypothetical protein
MKSVKYTTKREFNANEKERQAKQGTAKREPEWKMQ